MNTTNSICCECCGGREIVFAGSKRGWRLLECKKCSFIFVYPQPQVCDLESIYSMDQGYFSANSNASKNIKTQLGSNVSPLSHLLLKYQPPGKRLLDVGCAKGDIIMDLKNNGWAVVGTEINQGAAAIAMAKGLEVYEIDLELETFLAGSFDVIRFGQVLEHFRSPRRALEKAWELLVPGGLVYITVPNAKDKSASMLRAFSKVFRVDWPYSEAPYHLQEFNLENLGSLLESIGFSILLKQTYGKKSFAYVVGSSGYFDELKRCLKVNAGSTWQNFQLIVKNIPKLCIVTAGYAPFFLLGKLHDWIYGVGPKLMVIARRAS